MQRLGALRLVRLVWNYLYYSVYYHIMQGVFAIFFADGSRISKSKQISRMQSASVVCATAGVCVGVGCGRCVGAWARVLLLLLLLLLIRKKKRDDSY